MTHDTDGSARPAPRRPSRGPLLALGALLVLAVGAAAALLVLWLGARGDAADLSDRLTAAAGEVSTARSAAASAQSRAAAAEGAVAEAERAEQQAKADARAAAACRNTARAFIDAARGVNEDEKARLGRELVANC